MKEERKTKVSSEIEGLYSRERHLGRVRKLEKCNRLSKEV